MEPAVKPAAAATTSGIVGVLATPTTFEAEVFDDLVGRFATGIEVLAHPCPGWADLVERDGGDVDPAVIGRHVLPVIEAGCRHAGAGMHPLRLHRRPDRRGGRPRRDADRPRSRGRPPGGPGVGFRRRRRPPTSPPATRFASPHQIARMLGIDADPWASPPEQAYRSHP